MGDREVRRGSPQGFEKNLEEGWLLGAKKVLLLCKKEVLFGDRTEYCTGSDHGEGDEEAQPSMLSSEG
jgi:hypothetical protein